jgi:hypothetical protein
MQPAARSTPTTAQHGRAGGRGPRGAPCPWPTLASAPASLRSPARSRSCPCRWSCRTSRRSYRLRRVGARTFRGARTAAEARGRGGGGGGEEGGGHTQPAPPAPARGLPVAWPGLWCALRLVVEGWRQGPGAHRRRRAARRWAAASSWPGGWRSSCPSPVGQEGGRGLSGLMPRQHACHGRRQCALALHDRARRWRPRARPGLPLQHRCRHAAGCGGPRERGAPEPASSRGPPREPIAGPRWRSPACLLLDAPTARCRDGWDGERASGRARRTSVCYSTDSKRAIVVAGIR